MLRHDGDGVFVLRQPVTKNEIIGARSALFSINKLDIKKLNMMLLLKTIQKVFLIKMYMLQKK